MDPYTGSLLALSAGASAYSAFGPKQGPDYGSLDAIYSRRRQEIGDFAAQLTGARQKYLTSLGSMYDKAYTRFSGNAEAGFASRGLSVQGGAFASALAKESARYESELAPLAFQAEREDLYKIDDAYASAAGMNASGRSGGPGMSFLAQREDSQSLGRFTGDLAAYGLRGGFTEDGYMGMNKPESKYGGLKLQR